jgi:hypothetical protein
MVNKLVKYNKCVIYIHDLTTWLVYLCDQSHVQELGGVLWNVLLQSKEIKDFKACSYWTKVYAAKICAASESVLYKVKINMLCGDNLFVCLWPSISSETIRQSSVKFDVGVGYRKLWSKSEFHENWMWHSCFALVCKWITTLFGYFVSDLVTVSVEDLHLIMLSSWVLWKLVHWQPVL